MTARLIAFYRLQASLLWDWRPTRLALARRAILSFLVAVLALAITAAVLPGFTVDGLGALILGGLFLTILGGATRLLLEWLLVPVSILIVQAIALVFQIAVILVVGRVVPGIHVDGLATAIWGSVLLTVLNSFLSELVAVSDDDSYYSAIVRRLVANRQDPPGSAGRGLLVVQMDGVGRPVLEAAVQAGYAPVIGRLLRRNEATLHSWQPLLPPTTPASQAGILHGRADVVPGFRWYEKETGRMIVANRPDDAAEILRRVSDGHGLLAGDGASVGNLVTGDAPRSYLTMATIEEPQPADDKRRTRGFFVSTVNYVRLLVLTIGEVAKELYQAERQRSLGIEPRIHRGLHYAFERAITNVALRTISTSLVIEEMHEGAPIIYVDYTGYDAVAHHCGPQRQEAIDALEGIDRAIGSLLKAARLAPRRYDLVALSDHGQSLGATFSQRYGQPLEAVIAALLPGSATVISGDEATEHAGGGRRIAVELGRGRGVAPFAARRISTRYRAGTGGRAAPSTAPDGIVCSSGNLAHLYFAGVAGRLTRSEIEGRYPGLIAGLVHHHGIGAVLVRTEDGRTIAIGADGERDVDRSPEDGGDPLEQYGSGTVEALASLHRLPHLGDLILLGSFDADAGEVVGFEELVGSHGGLGGWQCQPFLMCPADWSPAADPLIGAAAVYQQLGVWLVGLGLVDQAPLEVRTAAGSQ